MITFAFITVRGLLNEYYMFAVVALAMIVVSLAYDVIMREYVYTRGLAKETQKRIGDMLFTVKGIMSCYALSETVVKEIGIIEQGLENLGKVEAKGFGLFSRIKEVAKLRDDMDVVMRSMIKEITIILDDNKSHRTESPYNDWDFDIQDHTADSSSNVLH
jgi:hypothetical protein